MGNIIDFRSKTQRLQTTCSRTISEETTQLPPEEFCKKLHELCLLIDGRYFRMIQEYFSTKPRADKTQCIWIANYLHTQMMTAYNMVILLRPEKRPSVYSAYTDPIIESVRIIRDELAVLLRSIKSYTAAGNPHPYRIAQKACTVEASFSVYQRNIALLHNTLVRY